jgi:lactoylglutathione lyase
LPFVSKVSGRQRAGPNGSLEMNQQEPATRVVGLAVVGIPVEDQDRALEFYVGRLGLEPRRDVALAGGRRWIELAPSGGAGTGVALVAARDGYRAGVETGIRFAVRDVDEAHGRLAQGGVDTDEVLRWPGVPAMFALRDPDGNGLEIIESA